MGLTVAKLAAQERYFTWHYLGEDVLIRYKPGVLTLAWDEQDVHVALSQTLVSIDITNGAGKPIKTDADTLVKTLTVPTMRIIARAIYEDAGVGPTTAETSDAT